MKKLEVYLEEKHQVLDSIVRQYISEERERDSGEGVESFVSRNIGSVKVLARLQALRDEVNEYMKKECPTLLDDYYKRISAGVPAGDTEEE